MWHWISNAFSVYILHTQRGDGYLWWSGPGADAFIISWFSVLYKHWNCKEPGCWRLGHSHPDHGRPVCHKHYSSEKVKPQ